MTEYSFGDAEKNDLLASSIIWKLKRMSNCLLSFFCWLFRFQYTTFLKSGDIFSSCSTVNGTSKPVFFLSSVLCYISRESNFFLFTFSTFAYFRFHRLFLETSSICYQMQWTFFFLFCFFFYNILQHAHIGPFVFFRFFFFGSKNTGAKIL